jgi:hypothetical protein
MNYFFDCPYCSQSFEVEAELAGLNCVCTGCGEVFVVPSPPRAPAEMSSTRLNDLDDMRPEVWTPEGEDHTEEANSGSGDIDPLAPQYAGDAIVGDQVVPVNFVPTGMETLPEVYGMIPEPENQSSEGQVLPAEVRVRRVTPMMIESSGMHHPNAQTGIVKGQTNDDQRTGGQDVKFGSNALRYAVLGVVAGLLMAWGGMRFFRKVSPGEVKIFAQSREVDSASDAKVNPEKDANEAGNLGQLNRFPDGFMGIKFGSKIDYISDRVTWAKEGENLHKPAMLADERVQAVLIPDHDGRLTVGAYVRISDKPDNELVTFLEWALTVQDAVTSKFGKPNSVHVVKNAATETEIVRKIRSGEDFYECMWEDPFNQCMITLSVAGRSSRLVVFRLEYKSIPLTRSYLNRNKVN